VSHFRGRKFEVISLNRIGRFFVCLLLAGLSLASCGQTPSTTAPSPGGNGNMTLKVGVITNAMSFFPLYVALQQNFFKAQGLTLNPSSPPGQRYKSGSSN
jgi:ABC-type nitrate/sulfonate/bicarbonate transport system substrate-binding protein